MYYCISKKTDATICYNLVTIGRKPSEITDFSCVSHNFENLTCSWTAPQTYVKTNYSLTYRFHIKDTGYFSCPEIKPSQSVDSRTKMSCFWNIHTDPYYRSFFDVYYFTLFAENEFGNTRLTYNFSHYANVIPGPPNDLTVIEKTTNSILLAWNIDFKMQHFPPGLVHRILYQCEFDTNKMWNSLDASVSPLKNSRYQFNLTGLRYPHALYDIRVSARSAKAHDLEGMWSRHASVITRIRSALPAAPPKLNMGSFEVINGLMDRSIIIYWQHILRHEENGENVTYQFVSVLEDQEERALSPIQVTNTYAIFDKLSLRSYKFTIATANEMGLSKNFSQIFVPSYDNKIPEPTDLFKIAFPDLIYELSWVPPVIPQGSTIKIDNYTIFWCKNDKERPHRCLGYLQWLEIPPNLTSYNVPVPTADIYQFAISANTKQGSSGMIWTSCSIIPMNGGVGKMNNIYISRVGPTFIYLTWKLDCSDHVAAIKGFKIFYCPIKSPEEPVCRDEERVLTISNPSAKNGNITNLEPYTTYVITVSAISKHNTSSLQSEKLYNNTSEAAPDSPPQNVLVSQVTNSSIRISWLPPIRLNGMLKYYEIAYKESDAPVQFQKVEPKQQEHVLDHLKSFTEYTFWIRACTVACSEDSQGITVRTSVSGEYSCFFWK